MQGAAATRSGEPAGPPAAASRPLRILSVGNMYPPHHVGGYELMWQAAVNHARSLGHTMRVLASDYRAPGVAGAEAGDVHRTLRWYWDLERYAFPDLRPRQRVALERHNAAVLRRHLRDLRPDLVSWWSMGCMSLSLVEQVRRAGTPAQFVVHDDWLIYGPGHDQWLRMWRGRRRWLAPLAERILGIPTAVALDRCGPFVFNSRYTLARAREAGYAGEEMSVVYPGIDEALIEPLVARPWGWRLVYVGRIDRQKGIDTAIRALAALPPEAVLAIWGTGDPSYVNECRALATELGVGERVRFQGWADPARRAEAYRDADVVVFPVRWEEPFGLVPIEAMAAGRPVVSTARGGSAEFLRDGDNALVFAADDDAGLAACVRRLAHDSDLRDHLGDEGLRTAATYTLERFARATVAAMQSTVTARR